MFSTELYGFVARTIGAPIENRIGSITIKNDEVNQPLIHFFQTMIQNRDHYFGQPYIRQTITNEEVKIGLTTYQFVQTLFGYYNPKVMINTLNELSDGMIDGIDAEFLKHIDGLVEYAFVVHKKQGLDFIANPFKGNISFAIAAHKKEVRKEIYNRIPKSWFNPNFFLAKDCTKITTDGDIFFLLPNIKECVDDPRIVNIQGQKGIREEFNNGTLDSTINNISFKEGYSTIAERTKKLHAKLINHERIFVYGGKLTKYHRNVEIDKPIILIVPYNLNNNGFDLPEFSYEGLCEFYDQRNLRKAAGGL